MSHRDLGSKAFRPLFLTSVFVSLCHCGGGSPASVNARDAKAELPVDAGVLDLGIPDTRMAVETSSQNPMDAAADVPPDAQPERIADARGAGGNTVDTATVLSPDGGMAQDLASPVDAAAPDVPPDTADAPQDRAQDQGIDTLATFEVGVDTTAVAPDLGARDSGSQCNDLDDSVAPLHDEVYVAGPIPLPTGGVIPDGLYYESTAQIYSTGTPAGPSGSQRRMVMRIAGSAIEAAYYTSSTGEHRFESDTIGPGSPDAGTNTLSLAQVCLSPNPRKALAMDLGYSVVGSGAGATLTFIYPTITLPGLGSQTIVLTLVRQ